MIYTVGLTETYNRYFLEYGSEFRKMGRSDNYVGGSAYLTIEDAKRDIEHIPGYSVWILDTDLDNVYKVNERFHIIESCQILPLTDE